MKRLSFLALALAGCLPSAPEKPTYAEDVEPILAAQCVRCHSDKSIGGAPPTFRLDTFADASRMAIFVATRAGEMGEMPPGGPELNQYQRDVLINWAKDPQQGTRAGNRAPTVSVTTRLEGSELVIAYDIDDPDGDRATGTVTLGGRQIASDVHAGRGEARFDVQSLASGTYPVVVSVGDDFGGEAEGTVDAMVQNERPQPFVAFRFVAAGANNDVYVAGEPAEVELTASSCQSLGSMPCTVPGATLLVDVYAFRGDEVHAVATQVGFADGQKAKIPLDTTGFTPGSNWRLRAVITNEQEQRTLVSAPFLVGRAEKTSPTLADVKPLFAKYCEPCHGDSSIGSSPGTQTNFLNDITDPNNPENCQEGQCYRGGIFGEVSPADVYRRVYVWQNMPPKSGERLVGVPQPTQAERKRMGDWILAGGPL